MSLSKIFVNNTQIVRVDDEPTAGSDNLVKSGGVFSSISAEIARAKTAEEANAQAITDEVARATAAEQEINNSSLKWLLPDTTPTDIPSAVLDVYAKSEITEDLYLYILGARYDDITDCVLQVTNEDNTSVVDTIHFDITGKKFMQVECAGLVFLLYAPNIKVNSISTFPIYYDKLHLNTSRRYIDIESINENIEKLNEAVLTTTKVFKKSNTSVFSLTIPVTFKKLYVNCHKILGSDSLSDYSIYLNNSKIDGETLPILSKCTFDKDYLVEITDDYDSIILYKSLSNQDDITIECNFSSYDNIYNVNKETLKEVDLAKASSLKWLLPDTTPTDIPSAVLDVYAKSEITEDLYLYILGARYDDISKCVIMVTNEDKTSIVGSKFFDITGKKFMQVECAGLVFLLYAPNIKVNSISEFPTYEGLHINTSRRYIDIESINTYIESINTYLNGVQKTFTVEGSETTSSRFSYIVELPFRKFYLNCHKVLGNIDDYNVYLYNKQTSSMSDVILENCEFDKNYYVEITENYDSVLLYNGNNNIIGVNIECIFKSDKNVDIRFESINSDIESINTNISLLYGKKIACFGDSITEFKYNGKGYCDWLAEYTGATVYNFGIGGTRIAQRAEPSSSPDNSKIAYAGVDICNMVKAFCSRDFSIVDACALYLKEHDSDNNVAIVNSMKDITPEEIDIVTIFGGTNDFTGDSKLGELGSTDNGTIYGGFDNIINYLLTVNPKLKIYVFTPIVRYFSNIRDEEHWSDNSVSTYSNLSGKTLPDIADLIEQMAKYRHIPCNNWYWTLGWNQLNFSSYFLDSDGTHPYKGFSFLAQKIKSFIESNF